MSRPKQFTKKEIWRRYWQKLQKNPQRLAKRKIKDKLRWLKRKVNLVYRQKECIRMRRRRKTIKYKKWCLEYQKKWNKRNPEKIKKWRENYYKRIGKEKIKELRKKWQSNKKGLCIKCKITIVGTKKKKYCKECLRKRMREFMTGNSLWKNVKYRPRGEKSPVWRGGITFWKKRIWDSPKYKQWRTAVFKRDNYICQKCKIKGKYLEAHHLKSFSELLRKYNVKSREEADKCNLLWNINLGQTLCLKCHQSTKNGRPK